MSRPPLHDLAHLAYLELLTPEFDRSVWFFTEVLGLTLDEAHPAVCAGSGDAQHRLGLVKPDDGAFRALGQGEGDHAGAAGHVQDALPGAGADGVHERAPPPRILAEAHGRTHLVIPAGQALEELERVTFAGGLGHRA